MCVNLKKEVSKLKMWLAGSSAHCQRDHQEIIFPVTLVDPISKIAEVRHKLIVVLKVINCKLRA
jgi:hypothetical protein